jgi:hypothetical protein
MNLYRYRCGIRQAEAPDDASWVDARRYYHSTVTCRRCIFLGIQLALLAAPKPMRWAAFQSR